MSKHTSIGRAVRLVALRDLLLDGGEYTALQLAELLGTTKRTIERDLLALRALGVDVQRSGRGWAYVGTPIGDHKGAL